jgi:predicted HicB family RNase H-like nuclease
MLKYKGYIGSAEVDVENRVLVGKLLFVRDSIAYSATSIEGLATAFNEAVDDYLAACVNEGGEPGGYVPVGPSGSN